MAARPNLGGEPAAVFADFEEQHARLVPRPLVPVHGAPHQHQWLADGEQLGLIDFGRFALGDPELDLATLLAELADESDRRVPMAVLTAAAVAGYAAGGWTGTGWGCTWRTSDWPRRVGRRTRLGELDRERSGRRLAAH